MLRHLQLQIRGRRFRFVGYGAFNFSTKASPETGTDDKIVAAVVLERLPVVIPADDPAVNKFRKFSFLWRQQFRRHYPQEFLDMSAEREDKSIPQFVPAPTITEADKSNDRRSLKRGLDQRLYLIVKGIPFGGMPKAPIWHFPEKKYEKEETLRKCAESVMQSYLGSISGLYFVGNAPCGHLAFPSFKRFYFLSQLIEDNFKFGHPKYKDFAWVRKEEFPEYFDPTHMEILEHMLLK